MLNMIQMVVTERYPDGAENIVFDAYVGNVGSIFAAGFAAYASLLGWVDSTVPFRSSAPIKFPGKRIIH